MIVPNNCRNTMRPQLLTRSRMCGARPVKPSAQPALVRTQHLPPAEVAGRDWYAKIARPLKVSGVPNRQLSSRWLEPTPATNTRNSP